MRKIILATTAVVALSIALGVGAASAAGRGGAGFQNGNPHGFSEGRKTGFVNGHPRGWSHGKKTGWGCTVGSRGCIPPGLR